MKLPTHRRGLFRAAACAALCLFSHGALGWGPHTEITLAALRAMGPEDGIYKQLGADTGVLAQYVWMADWRTQLLIRSDEVFYADDYLLFPKAKSHSQHICPEVRQTYAPFFRRALQALRTESPRNAARWVGSLLHFTTDTGSPPHAAGFLGAAHSKMENWLDAKLIQLPGYQPRLLGDDDASAEAGFLSRMEASSSFPRRGRPVAVPMWMRTVGNRSNPSCWRARLRRPASQPTCSTPWAFWRRSRPQASPFPGRFVCKKATIPRSTDSPQRLCCWGRIFRR